MVKTDILREMVDRVNDKYATAEIDRKVVQRDIDFVLSAFEDMVKENLIANHNEKVALGGLGSFKVKEVSARDGKSAINGKEWHKDAHSEIVFKVSKAVKDI